MAPRLYRSDYYVGNRTFVEDNPAVLYLRDHVYCPVGGAANCLPAVYDFGRKMVHQSFYSRGPIPSDLVSGPSCSFDYISISEYAEDDFYIYLGQIHNHFGHFLLSTLSRLWQIRSLPTSYKIIVYAGADFTVETNRPHTKELFRAFGVDIRRLISFQQPVKIRNLVLPCASFEERNFVHRVFGTSYNAAGDALVKGADLVVPGNGPIYLSKSKIKSGVRKIVNEDLIDDRLRAEGYAILHPETMSINDQVKLWRLGRPIVGFNSSGLHTSALSPDIRMISLGWDRNLDSSFILCDLANRSRSDYLYFESGTFGDLGPSPDHVGTSGLSSRFEALDPVGVAESILRGVDRMQAGNGTFPISRGKSTLQSSIYTEDDYDTSELSATSGVLTGRYQFCTNSELNPWWQVDLEKTCDISSIIIYNRTDDAMERAANLNICTSIDGKQFSKVYIGDNHAVFGGLNGEPLRVTLDSPVKGRFVRLSIPGPNFFHLDQVDVFGSKADPLAKFWFRIPFAFKGR